MFISCCFCCTCIILGPLHRARSHTLKYCGLWSCNAGPKETQECCYVYFRFHPWWNSYALISPLPVARNSQHIVLKVQSWIHFTFQPFVMSFSSSSLLFPKVWLFLWNKQKDPIQVPWKTTRWKWEQREQRGKSTGRFRIRREEF